MKKLTVVYAALSSAAFILFCAALTSSLGTDQVSRVSISAYEVSVDEESLLSSKESFVSYVKVTNLSQEMSEPFVDPVTGFQRKGRIYYRNLDLLYKENSQDKFARIKIFSDLSPKVDISAIREGDLLFVEANGEVSESGFLLLSPRYLGAVDLDNQKINSLRKIDVSGVSLTKLNAKFNINTFK